MKLNDYNIVNDDWGRETYRQLLWSLLKTQGPLFIYDKDYALYKPRECSIVASLDPTRATINLEAIFRK